MIYLDNNATTQPSPRVVEAMLPYLTECYFNASATTASITGADRPRRDAAAALAALLNAEEPDCFIFTSGATESNNWVFSSVVRPARSGSVVVSSIEHASVSEPAARLSHVGVDVRVVGVDQQGLVLLDALRDQLCEDTVLVSIMAANNETGVLQPVREVGQLIRERCPAAIFHTDATQAVGKVEIDLQGDWKDVDLLSFSGHKIHGPKGIGGLYLRQGLELAPMIVGGGQEQGRRSGTINTPGLAGLAMAAIEAREFQFSALGGLRDAFEELLLVAFPDAVIHSGGAPRLPNTSFCSLAGVHGEDLMERLSIGGIIVGVGAACSSGAMRPSKTLQSMGIPYDVALGGLRISCSRYSSLEDVATLVEALKAIAGEVANGRM